MKKKKKKSNVESILARAEKLFARGNYPLALKEFRKAQKKRPGDDLTEKIAVCQERAGEMKAKEAIKQGRRAEKKGALRAALKHFEEASLTCREEWLGPRIRQLKERLEGQSAEAEARKAEEAGDFEKAAEFYARAGGNGQSDDLSLKTARALVKAKKYADAADLFDALDVAKPADRYDHGLALAKSGRYVACLETWRKLDARDEQFADQIRAVCRGLAADLFDRFEKREDRAEIVRDATSLLESAGFDAPPAWRRPVENLRQYARYEWIEKLWEAEKFETIAELLESDPPTLLGPRAKTWFNLASADPRRIPTMMLYWMSAVYSHPISSNDRIVKKARQKLVDAADRLFREADGGPDGGRLAARLEIEKKLLSILHDLREKDEHGGESLHGGEVLYTPLFAAHLNKSGEMLALIGKHRSRFPDNEQYLETGAYYSTLGKSLFLMKSGEWDAVEKFLENA
ncbi:MAG: hypothetical protein GY859_15255, partial [Desulfobacterales bacterium]|nr:hypothetical protein [Desulfobacterales bacterium]